MGSCLSLSKDPSLFPPSLTLRIIKLSTCTNSPRGLFDYGVDTGLPSEVRVSDECQIVRRGTHIETPRLHTSSSAAIEKLVNVEIHSKHYWLSSPFRGLASSRDSCVWVLANNWEERGKELSEGDVIRLGMCSFAVKKLVCGKKSEEEKCLIAAVEEFSDAEVKCRICLRSENTEEEQIVCSPCKCLGSVRYVHLNCLRRWLKNQLIERENEYFHSYSWQELNCDICHAPYPNTIQCPDGKEVAICDMQMPESDYMILETVSELNGHDYQSTYIVQLDKKNVLKIGQGCDNEIKLKDSSISKCHAELRVENSRVYLADRTSKFGTYILLKAPMRVEPERPFKVLVGQTLMTLHAKKFPCCCYRRKSKKVERKYIED
eukprot:TRINITY_DN7168_c0_g1_i6.p1 TRINITY_DN7168_c0_g1~~TRINITY_DN7168_c0_g1_i6.p1  ORF type:complete len:376 (-),score=76.46 TRINITY_DN7168_c0_g1_i6:101-1228(-)